MGLACPKQRKMSEEDADAPPPPGIMPSEQDIESLFEATPAEPQKTSETSGPSAPPAASIAEEILCK